MADSSAPAPAPPTDEVANLHLDEVTGERISKTELKKRQKQREKEAKKAEKAAAAPPKAASNKPKNAAGEEEKDLNPNQYYEIRTRHINERMRPCPCCRLPRPRARVSLEACLLTCDPPPPRPCPQCSRATRPTPILTSSTPPTTTPSSSTNSATSSRARPSRTRRSASPPVSTTSAPAAPSSSFTVRAPSPPPPQKARQCQTVC